MSGDVSRLIQDASSGQLMILAVFKKTIFLFLNHRGFFVISSRGGYSVYNGIRICACLLGCIFMKFGISMGGFPSLTQCAQLQNWVYFGKFCQKSTQFGPNWVFFCRKWYIEGSKNCAFLGIANGEFSESGRHIHVQNLGENPPGGLLSI